MADHPRVPPKKAVALGYSRTARRYVKDPSKPLTRENTISHRQYEQRREGVTREEKTRRLKTGAAKYRTKQAARSAAYQSRTRDLQRRITGLAPADKRAMDAYRTKGWFGMTPAEQTTFRDSFNRYPPSQIREALGSPPVVRKAA